MNELNNEIELNHEIDLNENYKPDVCDESDETNETKLRWINQLNEDIDLNNYLLDEIEKRNFCTVITYEQRFKKYDTSNFTKNADTLREELCDIYYTMIKYVQIAAKDIFFLSNNVFVSEVAKSEKPNYVLKLKVYYYHTDKFGYLHISTTTFLQSKYPPIFEPL